MLCAETILPTKGFFCLARLSGILLWSQYGDASRKDRSSPSAGNEGPDGPAGDFPEKEIFGRLARAPRLVDEDSELDTLKFKNQMSQSNRQTK